MYIGDGTWGEGAVYEALNMAALWRLPLLVAVEHNGIAQTHADRGAARRQIAARAARFGAAYLYVPADDVAAMRDLLAPLTRIRDGAARSSWSSRTHRLGPHSKGDDPRGPEEVARRGRADWYTRYAATLGPRFAGSTPPSATGSTPSSPTCPGGRLAPERP